MLDFGIAKAASRATATEDGQLKGKMAYMAPEQLQHGAVDRRTDVFAASVVLWELLCGRRLFFADSPAEMMSRVLTSPIENPQKYAPEVPPELAAVTLRGLDRDPAGRFATAEDMAIAIEEAIAMPRSKDIGSWVATTAKLTLEARAQLVQVVESSSHKMPAAQQTSDPVLAKAIEEAERRRQNAEMATDVGGRTAGALEHHGRPLPAPPPLPPPPRAPGEESTELATVQSTIHPVKQRPQTSRAAIALAVGGGVCARARARNCAAGLEWWAHEAARRYDSARRRHGDRARRHRAGSERLGIGPCPHAAEQLCDERACCEHRDRREGAGDATSCRNTPDSACAVEEMRHRLRHRCAGTQTLQARMRRALIGRFGAIAAFSIVVLGVSPSMAQRSPGAAGKAMPSSKGGAKAACLAAHEDATALLTQKKPHAAHDKFVACARVECPTVVRKECGEQLALVEKDAPTVALEARDEAGMDTTAVKVTMDGSAIADRLTGSAVDVEPGEHVFRFERADGKSIEQKVLVVEGEKNRKVVADFATLVPKPPPPGGDGAPVTAHEPKKIPVLAYVAAGVGVVGLGGFAFFALTGKGAEKDLASSCNPNCSNDSAQPGEARLPLRGHLSGRRRRRRRDRRDPRVAGAHGQRAEQRGGEHRETQRSAAMDAAHQGACASMRLSTITSWRFLSAALGGTAAAGVLFACTLTQSLDYLQKGDGGSAAILEGGDEANGEGGIEGGGRVPLWQVTGQTKPGFLALDANNLYWIADGKVFSVPKATGGTPKLLGTVPPTASALTADTDAAGFVFAAVGTDVLRLAKDGSGAGGGVTVFAPGAGATIADTIGADDSSLFVLQYDENGTGVDARILRMAKDGGAPTDISGDGGATTMTLDPSSVLWLSADPDKSAFIQHTKTAPAGMRPAIFALGPNDNVPAALLRDRRR